jgi:hypothetical protein
VHVWTASRERGKRQYGSAELAVNAQLLTPL